MHSSQFIGMSTSLIRYVAHTAFPCFKLAIAARLALVQLRGHLSVRGNHMHAVQTGCCLTLLTIHDKLRAWGADL